MPRIEAVGCALPPYKLTQTQIREFVQLHFSQAPLPVDKLLEVFANAEIEERYFSVPMEWYREEKSFEEKNQTYINSCCTLGEDCARKCLSAAGVKPQEIDYIIFVSTTGLATPSIDARLINQLQMRSDIKRTPVWGLGCAGGAAGISQAFHYLLGHPRERVLLVAIELCGLTFQQNDFSRSNFVATALFGEGAAAVLLSGDQITSKGLEILATRSTFWPDSLDIMGWNLMNSGLQVVFSQSIPHIVETRARENLEKFLGDNDLLMSDIQHFILHPGGAKVIDAYEKALGAGNGELSVCRDVLRRYGNMSSVSVLFVLSEHMRTNRLGTGEYGIISALGPGFCSENILIKF
jgi:alkylresorcinol/alkylpyrone synthase